MLDSLWLLALGVALGTGLWFRHFAVSMGAALGLLIALSAMLWRRFALRNVTCNAGVDRCEAAFGERVHLTVEVINDKILPLTWLRAEQDVPAQLEVQRAPVRKGRLPLTNTLVHAFALMPYERIVRRYPVVCAHRGDFIFRAPTVESGDPLGVVWASTATGSATDLVVYPKILRVDLSEWPRRSRTSKRPTGAGAPRPRRETPGARRLPYERIRTRDVP